MPTGAAEMIRKLLQPQLLEVLDRILDKGIVIDASVRFSLAGIDFLTVESRLVVASMETYLEYAPAPSKSCSGLANAGTLTCEDSSCTVLAPSCNRARSNLPV